MLPAASRFTGIKLPVPKAQNFMFKCRCQHQALAHLGTFSLVLCDRPAGAVCPREHSESKASGGPCCSNQPSAHMHAGGDSGRSMTSRALLWTVSWGVPHRRRGGEDTVPRRDSLPGGLTTDDSTLMKAASPGFHTNAARENITHSHPALQGGHHAPTTRLEQVGWAGPLGFRPRRLAVCLEVSRWTPTMALLLLFLLSHWPLNIYLPLSLPSPLPKGSKLVF